MKPSKSNQTRRYSRPVLAVLFLSALFMIPFGSYTKAQKTNYSGEWILNESESDMGEGMFRMTKAMKVTQEGNNFELQRTRTGRNGEERTSTENLTLDGEVTVNEQGNRKTESSVTWSEDGKSITITTNSSFSREGQTFEMKNTEVWTLDKKGKILTVDYTGSSPRGERKAKLVYDKK